MGRRTRLTTGIYQDASGISVMVRNKEHRYPRGTPLEELRLARKERLADAGDRIRAHTFAADVAAYLLTLDGQARRDARNLLGHWIAAGFGPQSRHSITAMQIQQQLQAWRGRFAPATRKALRSRLSTFYRTMNGAGGANPVRDVPPVVVRYEEPRAIPYPLIETILAAMGPSLSKLRLTIMAYTGLTQAMLGRVQARDLNLELGTVYARPRRKGAGTEGRTQPLAPQAVEAFRQLIAADGLGPFYTGGVSEVWWRALDKVRAAWPADQPWPLPADVRPYDLRHSYATHVLAATGQLQTVASLLMHSNIQTTRRYTQGAVSEESRAAISKTFSKTGAETDEKAPPMPKNQAIAKRQRTRQK